MARPESFQTAPEPESLYACWVCGRAVPGRDLRAVRVAVWVLDDLTTPDGGRSAWYGWHACPECAAPREDALFGRWPPSDRLVEIEPPEAPEGGRDG
jgi:hypothetical protein